jgi:hypothetical protein
MSVAELIAKLQQLPPDMEVFVAESPSQDHVPLEMVLPREHAKDYVLLGGEFED